MFKDLDHAIQHYEASKMPCWKTALHVKERAKQLTDWLGELKALREIAKFHPGLMPHCKIFNVMLDSGRHVQINLNTLTGRLVVDVVHPNELGGNEVVRMDLNAVDLSHAEEGYDD